MIKLRGSRFREGDHENTIDTGVVMVFAASDFGRASKPDGVRFYLERHSRLSQSIRNFEADGMVREAKHEATLRELSLTWSLGSQLQEALNGERQP